MPAPIVKEADPPLATITTEGDPTIAGYFLGAYDPLYFSEDFLVDWYTFNDEEDPDPTPIDVDDDPPLVTTGVFDEALFDVLLFDTGVVSIDDDPPHVAIMVEAEP